MTFDVFALGGGAAALIARLQAIAQGGIALHRGVVAGDADRAVLTAGGVLGRSRGGIAGIGGRIVRIGGRVALPGHLVEGIGQLIHALGQLVQLQQHPPQLLTVLTVLAGGAFPGGQLLTGTVQLLRACVQLILARGHPRGETSSEETLSRPGSSFELEASPGGAPTP
ncbi:hypothetical protein [Kineococcus sp. SYSU DK005]|uniref:hypothetical protein n=1 Tax=Kineococcus sp. SYSU DK005 TaxID=3383126 RepID=UPI003D7DF5A4